MTSVATGPLYLVCSMLSLDDSCCLVPRQCWLSLSGNVDVCLFLLLFNAVFS